MNVTNIASIYVEGRQEAVRQSLENTMLKKTMDMEKQQGQNALALISSVTPSSALPDNIGQNLNVVA